MALNGLLNSDPEKALPILEKLLQGPASPKLRERAVFVLAQSNSPKAREILKAWRAAPRRRSCRARRFSTSA